MTSYLLPLDNNPHLFKVGTQLTFVPHPSEMIANVAAPIFESNPNFINYRFIRDRTFIPGRIIKNDPNT